MSKNTSEVSRVKPQKEEDMEFWTPAEKETCKTRYGCEILIQNGSYPRNKSSFVRYVLG